MGICEGFVEIEAFCAGGDIFRFGSLKQDLRGSGYVSQDSFASIESEWPLMW